MFCFSYARRLQNKKDYDYVFADANKIVTSEFILLHRENCLGHARIGLALSKKMIAKACQRNRLKRVLRESFRVHILPPIDIVVLARHGVAKADNTSINANLDKAWNKLIAFYVN